MTSTLSSRPSPVDALVFVGLAAAAIECGDPGLTALAVALGAVAFGVVFIPHWAHRMADLVGVQTPAQRRRAFGVAACCCGAVGMGAVLPRYVDSRTRGGHSPLPLTPWLLASSVIEGVRNSLHLRPSPLASGPVEYWHAGVRTGAYFLLPRDGDGAAGAVVQVPRDALDGNGAPHAERGPVFRFEEAGTREVVLAEPSSGADGYPFNFTLRRPPGPPVAGRYWLVIRIYRGYDRDPDPERRTSLVEEVTALIDDSHGKAKALGR